MQTKKILNKSDEYYIYMFNKILQLAPIIGLMAALTFTLTRYFGIFSYVDIKYLIVFDCFCLSYFLDAFILKKVGIIVDGKVAEKNLVIIDIILCSLILLQWNLITYIFPSRDLWGYAPMFVLLTSFMFRTKAVLCEIGGISLSIIVSWILLPNKLLPVYDEFFDENLGLRIVCLIISFIVIYILTNLSNGFIKNLKDNYYDIEKQNNELENLGKDIIDFTADIIEERDTTSGSHVKRLKNYVRILARQIANDWPEYNLDGEKIEQIALASVLHDVGKIAIPDAILLKPGKLTSEEFEVIKSHTTLGAQIIDKLPDSVGEEYKKYCRDICLFHHEKYDGKGYPVGLKGDDIPIAAQIVSVVDCFDALSNERPYKKALPSEVAIKMIINGECGVFSDKMKKSILACKEELINL